MERKRHPGPAAPHFPPPSRGPMRAARGKRGDHMSTQTTDSKQPTIDVTDYIDKRQLNAFNFQLVVLSFLVIMVDGYDITVAGFAVPQLASAWGIANLGAFGPALGASLIGMLFGAPLLGHVGDRFGRKPAILISYVIFGIFTLATAWVGSLGELAVLRFL